MIQNFFKIALLLFFCCVSICCKTGIQSGNVKLAIPNKELSLSDYDKMLEVKENINTSQYSFLYKKMLKDAEIALLQEPYSVMQKTQIPPSGSKHDYISLGPYWWPDSKKKDGLPWIRKDGEVNPLTREGSTDYETKNNMFHNTNTLVKAYFFSDEIKYAKKAIELIKVWFLNEDTKMNPNLNFAQGIPGKNTGRGIGIIEFSGIANVITAIEILELNEVMDSKTSQELRQWFAEYLNWLQTSENGVFEKNTKNNHAVHYDLQVVSILLFLEKEKEAKQLLETVKTKRIATQIESDGKQPHELARTKSLSYSTMNLKGFTQLAYLGTKINVDLWNFEAKNGASIIKAYEFLKPYAKGEKDWNYEQIHSLTKAKKSLRDLFAKTGSQFSINEYFEIGSRKGEKATSLIFNCN